MSISDRPVLRLGHSPDPDDAFMWWPLFERGGQPPCVDGGQFRFVGETADIETLNQRAAANRDSRDLLEITAISCAQYPQVKDRYALTACGASMGERYGPKLVANAAMDVRDLTRDGVVIAVPGTHTTAFTATSLLLGRGNFRYAVVPFEQIIDRVRRREFAAGLIIHEGQLTYQNSGLHQVEDLGSWWWREHQLPLPLGVNTVRRDLEQMHGPGTLLEVAATLRRSVEYALAHRAEAVEYAMGFARDMNQTLADRFIDMYVNKWTLDFGPSGRQAVQRFLEIAHEAGVLGDPGTVDFIGTACPAALKGTEV